MHGKDRVKQKHSTFCPVLQVTYGISTYNTYNQEIVTHPWVGGLKSGNSFLSSL